MWFRKLLKLGWSWWGSGHPAAAGPFCKAVFNSDSEDSHKYSQRNMEAKCKLTKGCNPPQARDIESNKQQKDPQGFHTL